MNLTLAVLIMPNGWILQVYKNDGCSKSIKNNGSLKSRKHSHMCFVRKSKHLKLNHFCQF